MTTLPALRAPACIEPRLERLSFTGHKAGVTRRAFIFGCLSVVAGQVANLLDRLAQLPLLRIRFP
ncbi:hypothetical protein JQ615_30635 [Bradyrhizobium jicamae]|uniref:Uncharacterized protein n=1 Tax=Bradyrhizobium jicamae TaxID=280332 RepID=A0ABS5FSH4_9BRAD|nr:hypothetical protein [Bradyrhizobium jicamae]MBR0799737.1 hypothetical protein [Bradyrhizobium jicamae]MBR0933965.1 hypothetical protein [Bradyrhizobium jicamae]